MGSSSRALWTDMSGTPCVSYSCELVVACKQRALACDAWRVYVETGRAMDPRYEIPLRETERRKAVLRAVVTATRSKMRAADRA